MAAEKPSQEEQQLIDRQKQFDDTNRLVVEECNKITGEINEITDKYALAHLNYFIENGRPQEDVGLAVGKLRTAVRKLYEAVTGKHTDR